MELVDKAAPRRSWLLVVAAGLLLATPRPPSLLSYDLSGLAQPRVKCTITLAQSCADAVELARAAPAKPPPPVVIRVPPERGVRLVVSLPQQRLYVFRNGELLTTSAVSTGKRGHGTPAGTFRILQKAVIHHSNLYSNAPMPYMQRLTQGGVALHAGHVPGYPASHGCIRLPWAMAKKLYAMTSFSTTTVTVTRTRLRDADAAFKLVKPIEIVERPRATPVIETHLAPPTTPQATAPSKTTLS